MKRIRRTPRGNRCDKSQDSQGILLFVLKRGKIAISRQPLLPDLRQFINCLCRRWRHVWKFEAAQLKLLYNLTAAFVHTIMSVGCFAELLQHF